MELLALFFNSFVVGFSGAMMPGPLLAVDIAETPRKGWSAGPILSVGHAVAEIAVVVVLSLGIAALAQNPMVASAIGVIGGVALILMGGSMAYEIIRGRLAYSAGSGERVSNHKLAGKGITATLSNPYWFVWWATTGLAFLVKSLKFGFIGPVVFYFGHIMSDFVWYSFVSVLLWQGKRLLMGRGLKVLILVCAAFLVWLGATFIRDGISGELARGLAETAAVESLEEVACVVIASDRRERGNLTRRSYQEDEIAASSRARRGTPRNDGSEVFSTRPLARILT